MATIQLSNEDARLTYLAIQYHLSRPGSELDQESGKPAASGLRETASALEPQLELAVASVELDAAQQQRLHSAIGGTINELKATPILEAGGRGTMPAFTETLNRLYPEVAQDPEESMALAGHMLQLRRRFAAQSAADSAMDTGDPSGPENRPWWRFWR
jgi:hypothetical protein